ncbi:Zn-dependent hydrolase [Knoellia sinensis KCTC 19936]|uniref:Zn-dependent hydrolase n=2 Tax=Knoellia TaxID=136099 RepID=A0A0A0J860_9MICO|nr:Zn-dependent hydrolase [Knoellia sinensis KCTC 19936]
MAASPEWSNGRFHNQQLRFEPSSRSLAGGLKDFVSGRQSRHPVGDVPLVRGALGALPEGTRVTWLGHSTVLVQIDGAVVLLDPVWSDRCSPSQQVGPRRLHPVPVALRDLPPVDAVVISHDHYDHLDMDSIKDLARLRHETRFVVPLGIGAHLEKWGVPADRIDELDWHEDTKVAGVRLVATPAQHFSGRGLSRDGTLWASWVLEGETSKVFYSGDTGYFVGFAQIGERYGPFDLALVQVGAYDTGWPTIHMTPEHGVEAAMDVGAAAMVPVHWGTFNLAFHPWSEPIERVLVEAERHGMRVVVPRPGEPVDVSALPDGPSFWWRSVT